MIRRICVVAATLVLLNVSSAGLLAQALPAGDPVALGLSAERLGTLDAAIQRFVDEKQHAGVVWLVARRGKIVDFNARGLRDIASKKPMEKDSICRMYSMSKIITSVAALILLEEGRYNLDDPVSRFLPEFKKMQVMTGGTADEPLLTTARRPITIRHLFTHTSGLYYDFVDDAALVQIFRRVKPAEAPTLEEFVKRAASLPLKHQPGEAFTYGINTDVLGRLIEVVSGQSLEAFMRQRIFEPLGMVDTGFSVASEKMARLAKTYNAKDGQLVEAEPAFGAWAEAGRGPAFGGAGIFSTAVDYARFAQMLLNGGVMDGRRILGRKTVEFMTANHLSHLPGGNTGARHLGFGLGVSVLIDLGQSPTPGSPGAFGWTGAATTLCQIDPKEQMVLLVLAQHFPYNEHRLFERFLTCAYQALAD